MPLEAFTFINSLNPSNPTASDDSGQGDDHLRGIKAALKATFPNITGAATVTHTVLSNLGDGKVALADGTLSAPSASFTSDPTLGLYKAAAGTLGVSGNLTVQLVRGNGSCPVGLIGDFLVAFVPSGWLICNGAEVSRTTYADLFAYACNGGSTPVAPFGPGNGTTTFALPNIIDRYRRASGTSAPGTFQDDQNKAHTHTGTTGAQSNDHTHSGSTSTGGAHQHAYNDTYPNTITPTFGMPIEDGGGVPNLWNLQHSTATSSAGDHFHSFATGGASAAHTHNFTTDSDGGSEARPKTVVVMTCIKT